MRIDLDQDIAASAPAVQAAFVDPSFYGTLGDLPGISAPVLRSFERRGDDVHMVVGYRFAGELNGPARRLLDPARLTWAQVNEVDVARRRTQVHMEPDNYAGLLSFSGWYELQDAGEGRCCQHLEADLRVHVPLLGPLAEKALAGSVRDNLRATASLIERWLHGHHEARP